MSEGKSTPSGGMGATAAIDFTAPNLKLLVGAVAESRFEAVSESGAELTYSLTRQAGVGTAVVNADGTYSYTPNAEYEGSDSFRIRVEDGSGTAIERDIQLDVGNSGGEMDWGAEWRVLGRVPDRAVLLANGQILASWRQGATYFTQVYAPDGSEVGGVNSLPPETFSSTYYIYNFRLRAHPDGGAVLDWMARRRSSSGSTIGYSRIVQRVDVSGATSAAPIELRLDEDNGGTWSPQDDSFAVLSDGAYAVTWTDRPNGNIGDIALQIFNADGSARTQRIAVTAHSGLEFLSVAKPLPDGGVVLVWEGRGAFARVYDKDGQALTPEIELTETNVTYLEVAALDDGGFVAYWQEGSSGNYRAIAQRVAADGSLIGEQIVLLGDANQTGNFEVVDLPGGGFVFGWADYAPDSGAVGSFMQPYSSDGIPVSDPIRITDPATPTGTNVYFESSANGSLIAQWGANFRYFVNQGGLVTEDGETVFGNAEANEISGLGGDDHLIGGDGDDTLTGGDGRDTLDGGDGDDVLIADIADASASGGAGLDTLLIDASSGTITLSAAEGTVSSGGQSVAVSGVERFGILLSGALSDSAEPGSGGESGVAGPDLIVNLSDGYSQHDLTQVMDRLGAVVTYGAGEAIQFWDVLDEAVDVDAVLAEYDFAQNVDLNAEISLDVEAPDVVSSQEIGAQLLADAQTEFSAAATPNDPSFGSLYGMQRISAPDAWERRTDASSVVIGVIDTGIDVDHPDLVNNMWVNEGEIWGDGIDNDGNGYIDDYHGYDFYNNRGIGPGSNSDGHGHGTHVAGTIAAEGNNGIGVSGVAWNASLMAVKIFSDAGRTNTSAIIAGIQYATMMGAQVTNNSWGGGLTILRSWPPFNRHRMRAAFLWPRRAMTTGQTTTPSRTIRRPITWTISLPWRRRIRTTICLRSRISVPPRSTWERPAHRS